MEVWVTGPIWGILAPGACGFGCCFGLRPLFPVLLCIVPIRKSGWGICISATSLFFCFGCLSLFLSMPLIQPAECTANMRSCFDYDRYFICLLPLQRTEPSSWIGRTPRKKKEGHENPQPLYLKWGSWAAAASTMFSTLDLPGSKCQRSQCPL